MGTYRTYENIKAVILDMAGHPRITYKEIQPLIGGGVRDIYKALLADRTPEMHEQARSEACHHYQ